MTEWREQNGETDKSGTELYSRRAKAIVEIAGSASETSSEEKPSTATSRIGHTLEIVPVSDPYGVASGDPMQFVVYFENAPLAGAQIRLDALDPSTNGFTSSVRAITDDAGRAVFVRPRKGSWKLNVVWSTPAPGNDAADFETFFASLVFGWSD